MALYNKGNSMIERALNQGGGTGPSQGAETTTTQETNKAMESLSTGMAGFDMFGKGNATAGAAGSAVAPTFVPGASLGYKFGQKADNPWEAFIAGGAGANKEGMFSFIGKDGLQSPSAAHFFPQDPVSNYIAGGLSGVAGFLF